MNIENKLTSSFTTINIQKIEKVILMWDKINYLTSDNKNSSLQTIDIPVDENINWNDIKKHQTYNSNHKRSRNNEASSSRKKFSPSKPSTRHTINN